MLYQQHQLDLLRQLQRRQHLRRQKQQQQQQTFSKLQDYSPYKNDDCSKYYRSNIYHDDHPDIKEEDPLIKGDSENIRSYHNLFRRSTIKKKNRKCIINKFEEKRYKHQEVRRLISKISPQIITKIPRVSSIRDQYISLSIVFLVALSSPLVSYRHAVSCLGTLFDDSILFGHTGLNHHSNTQQSTRPPMNHNYAFWNLPTANTYGEPMDDAQPLPMDDSTLNDQITSPGLAASGWTSLMSSSPNSLDTYVRKILVPRVSGTPGIVKVREYIVDSMRSNGYTVQLDEFIDNTPIGRVGFSNIIAYSNPNACRQLVLACHYDSKMMDGFLGAVDSAVPCAMLLKLSETFKDSFRSGSGDQTDNSIGLQFIFFDGEEAFVEWGPKDSLYGSRHLAEKWSRQKPPAHCKGRNELSRIELFVLLDLIGSKDTSFVMYNRQLQGHYNDLRKYEKVYLTEKLRLTGREANKEAAFRNRYISLDLVQDDHVPFKERGVPILSLLAHPFPRVWHTINDNYEAIDYPRTERILHVLEKFVSNYS